MAIEQHIPQETQEKSASLPYSSVAPLDTAALELLDRALSEQSAVFERLLDRLALARLSMFLFLLLTAVGTVLLNALNKVNITSATGTVGLGIILFLLLILVVTIPATQMAVARKRINRMLPQFEELIRTASQVHEHGALPNSLYKILLRIRLAEAEELYAQARAYAPQHK